MDIHDFVKELEAKNETRRSSGLPLYDLEKEKTLFIEREKAKAYQNFLRAEMRPYMNDWTLWPNPSTSWSESMARQGRFLKLQAQVKPNVDQRWAEMLQIGTWINWKE